MKKTSLEHYTDYIFEGDEKTNTKTRVAVRGFFKKDNLYLVNKVKRNDIFGNITYYESPGGGKKENETLLETLKREFLEETGYEVINPVLIDITVDSYNLIKQNNITFFFTGEIKEKEKIDHKESYGDSLIISQPFLSLDELIEEYQKMNTDVADLIKQRELPVLIKLKERSDL